MQRRSAFQGDSRPLFRQGNRPQLGARIHPHSPPLEDSTLKVVVIVPGSQASRPPKRGSYGLVQQ